MVFIVQRIIKFVFFLITFLFICFLPACNNTQDSVNMIGRFDHQDNDYTYIVFYEDGNCEFTFSYFGGVCEANATYTIQDDKLRIILVNSKPTDSYPGDFVIDSHQEGYIGLEYEFTIIDKNTIQIDDTLYAAYEGSQFVRLLS